MRILITGGAGFIGSNIQDAYLKLGHEVAIIDSLITGNRENLNPKARFIELDINSPEIFEIFKDFKPEVINHHAAQMDVRKSVVDPSYDAKVNILGFINLLEAAQKAKSVKKIIFASTGGAIYGEQDYFPADEHHPIRPASPYGLSKRVGEEYLGLYERLYGIKPMILRYANVYGPRQNPHGEAGVVAIFCKKLLSHEKVTINGDGSQTRDYVYIEDVVRANVLALEEKATGIFNIGTNIESDVKKVYQILSDYAGQGGMEYGPAKPGEQKRSVVNYQLIEQTFGWKPTVSLKQGLCQTYDWFRDNKK